MVGALSGVAACSRCGGDVESATRSCPRCGIALLDPADGTAVGSYSPLLAGVKLASPARRATALVLDAAVVIVPVVLVAVGAGVHSTASLVSGTVLLVAVLALEALLAVRAGRSLGRLVAGIRAVDDLTGEPRVPGASGRPLSADVRGGRDPRSPAPLARAARIAVRHPGMDGAETPDAEVRQEWGRRLDAAPSPSVLLVLDSGEVVELAHALLIGRLPDQPEDVRIIRYPWADLSRSLARTHALLEWSGTTLWVTDQGTRTGSSLLAPDGSRQQLVPGLRGAAVPGWTIELGRRRIELRDSGVREEDDDGE